MRYKVDTEKKEVEVIEAEGKELLSLGELFPDYTLKMGNDWNYTINTPNWNPRGGVLGGPNHNI